jgi:pimeloyl-ACP methyl ester carboxylesterase
LAVEQDKILFRNCRGDTLSGVLHHPEANSAGASVILCHGMESNKNSDKLVLMSDALAARGILTLRFDFAYAGESSGKFEDITCSGEVDDLQAAYALIQNRQPGKTAIFGSSLGGTVALLFAAREATVAALVTLAAPLHPENFPRRILTLAQCQQWREQRFTIYNGQRLNVSLLEDLESIQVSDSVRRIKCPVLILHGDADEIIPVEEAYELHACLSSAKRLSILPGTDHRLSDPVLLQRAITEALDWLTEHVS